MNKSLFLALIIGCLFSLDIAQATNCRAAYVYENEFFKNNLIHYKDLKKVFKSKIERFFLTPIFFTISQPFNIEMKMIISYTGTVIDVLGDDEEKSQKALLRVYSWVYTPKRSFKAGKRNRRVGIDPQKLAALRKAIEYIKTQDDLICTEKKIVELTEQGKEFISPYETIDDYVVSFTRGDQSPIQEFYADSENYNMTYEMIGFEKSEFIKVIKEILK